MKDTDPTTSATMIEVPDDFKIPARTEAPAVNPEMITVPDEIKMGLAEAAGKLAAAQEAATPQVIESMPGAPVGAYRSPEQVVEEIKSQLANRDPSLGQPEIQAGDIVTQRGQ